MELNKSALDSLDNRFRALFINSLSGFKSANLVGTCNTKKQSNLSIVSSVVHLGANPPLLAMIIRPHSVPRDTLENILSTGVYTLNHVNEDIYKQAHQTSARYDSSCSEFTAVGLQEAWKADFAAPFVAESHIKLGMELREHHHLAINGTEMVIGEIVHIDVPDECIAEDGYVSLERAGTVAVSSLDSYHSTNLLAHLSYAKADIPLKHLSRNHVHSIFARQQQQIPDRVLVIGASGGIGQAMCEQLLEQFPHITLIRMARDCNKLPALNSKTTDISLDLSSDTSIDDAMSQLAALADTQALDWVLTTTGWLHDDAFKPEKSVRHLQREHLQHAYDVNAIGPALVLKSLLAQLDKKHPLKIGILSARVGSISDNRLGGWHAYRASKAALNMLIKNTAIECQHTRRPCTIVGLQPGTTDTELSQPFQRGVSPEHLQTPNFTATRLIQVMQALQAEDSGKLFDFEGLTFAP
ncbi:MAG: Nitrilotriacetate monooxygenase component B (EC [uncultured Thiotrichaceae bacterium]|uniref:Nitrilotriacetate monooxygenase component B (EC) n=1 Tax=uncultured Thiotrichaceae bacterium TaxID=298394 RepID=A0A6S6TMN5_9GAMM|nr:MAG: Nitrilotriacetate monooxygenase component B (EC [uncultured Thiotrichaceae bacterium]